jgi:hypothetical protein
MHPTYQPYRAIHAPFIPNAVRIHRCRYCKKEMISASSAGGVATAAAIVRNTAAALPHGVIHRAVDEKEEDRRAAIKK